VHLAVEVGFGAVDVLELDLAGDGAAGRIAGLLFEVAVVEQAVVVGDSAELGAIDAALAPDGDGHCLDTELFEDADGL